MPELILKLGDSVLQTFVFDKDIISVGRSRDNDIVIENLSVSRNHARIRRQGGKYVLTDLNSANGTLVNGVKVSKTEIVDNDVIALGKHRLQFVNKVLSEDQMIVASFGADRTMIVDRAPMAVLSITDGKSKGQTFQLNKAEVSIGKAANNDVVIGGDWFLSKKQALIKRAGESYEIQDLGGFRKTKVNGIEIAGPTLLKNGDTVEFGNTKCLFQFGGDAGDAGSGRTPKELAVEDSIFSGVSDALMNVVHAGDPTMKEPLLKPASVSGIETEDNEPGAIDISSDSLDGIDFKSSVAALGMKDAPSDPGRVGKGGKKKKKDKERGKDFVTGQFSAKPDKPELSPAIEILPPVITPETDPQIAAIEANVILGSDTSGVGQALPKVAAGGGSTISAEDIGLIVLDNPPSEPTPVAAAPPKVAAEPPTAKHGTIPVEGAPAGATPEAAKEIAIWEKALQNKSAVIRKQAAQQLKKLTGKDYAH
ncbi:MAG: FHA domain-containing protein [Candidatus Sumerlaeaceae bacterium]|nr:FHA domain-containing protein [Candidatus Sumerlaeaceae bacterium]